MKSIFPHRKYISLHSPLLSQPDTWPHSGPSWHLRSRPHQVPVRPACSGNRPAHPPVPPPNMLYIIIRVAPLKTLQKLICFDGDGLCEIEFLPVSVFGESLYAFYCRVFQDSALHCKITYARILANALSDAVAISLLTRFIIKW